MGNNVVAVLYTDMIPEMERPDAGKRLANGVLSFINGREDLKGWFGFGQVFSWDHSSGYQVCVVGRNAGYRVGFDNDVPDDVLRAVADVLKMREWKVTAPKSK
jgi:hypothetical protein